jgi:hypothetical protein
LQMPRQSRNLHVPLAPHKCAAMARKDASAENSALA